MTIQFAPEAEADFATVIGYIAERNPTAAAEFGQRLFAIIDQLGTIVRSWPCRLCASITSARARHSVLRIYHQARAPLPR